MTTSQSLPARPSLESLRKQAKKLARDIAAGDAGAIARARAQLLILPIVTTGYSTFICRIARRARTPRERFRTQLDHVAP
jgi:hypothetical protein